MRCDPTAEVCVTRSGAAALNMHDLDQCTTRKARCMAAVTGAHPLGRPVADHRRAGVFEHRVDLLHGIAEVVAVRQRVAQAEDRHLLLAEVQACAQEETVVVSVYNRPYLQRMSSALRVRHAAWCQHRHALVCTARTRLHRRTLGCQEKCLCA